MDVKIWILSVVISVLAVILGWILKQGIKGIYERLDELIEQNTEMGRMLVKQTGEIDSLKQNNKVIVSRLDNHSARLHKLELDHAKCFKG